MKETAMVQAIRQGVSQLPSATDAVAELAMQLAQPDVGLVMIFCSPQYDRVQISAAYDKAAKHAHQQEDDSTNANHMRILKRGERLCLTHRRSDLFTKGRPRPTRFTNSMPAKVFLDRQQGWHFAPRLADFVHQTAHFFQCGDIIARVRMDQATGHVAVEIVQVAGQIAAFFEIQRTL